MTEITWFKLYHEALDDPKFCGIADRIQSRPGDVFHVFLKLLKRASENEDRGSLVGFDDWGEAAWLRIPVEEVRRIVEAIRDIGMIVGDRIAKWAKRQGAAAAKLAQAPVSAAAQRTRRWRQKKARDPRQQEMLFAISGGAPSHASPVASRPSHASPTPSPNAGDTDSESDTSLSEESDGRARARRSFASGDFDEFWKAYPHKVDQTLARAAFASAVREGAGLEEILAGIERYCAARPADREWINPANFLKRKRWLDQPADKTTSTESRQSHGPSEEGLRWLAEYNAQYRAEHAEASPA
jgi:hypothetical protein